MAVEPCDMVFTLVILPGNMAANIRSSEVQSGSQRVLAA